MRLRQLFEEQRRTAVMAFGRMNPPTIGHAKLVDAIKAQPGDPYIFLSQSQKPKTDPLQFQDKLRYAKFFFPNVTIGNPEVKTIIQALQKVETMGYTDLIYVAGSDRVESFKELINKYNGKDYTFKNIEVISAGERDPDADGAEGMSASKMRQAAADDDFDSFKQGVPQQELASEMFKAVRQGMGLTDVAERELSKAEIKSRDKTADKIMDKPKAKKSIASWAKDKGMDPESAVYAIATNMAKKKKNEAVEIPVVDYDRNYGGDISKVLAVKPNAKKDANEIYKQLGGISNKNYEKLSNLVQAKIQELRNEYRAKAAKDGLKGKDALHSDHYKLFRKQSADLNIMLSTAMDMMTKASGAKGQVIKPNVTPGYTAKILGK